MLNKFLTLNCVLVIAVGSVVVNFPDGLVALAFVTALSVIAITIIRRSPEEKEFLTTLFLVALALRMAFGIFVHIYDLRSFFGGDALAYDAYGQNLLDVWMGRDQLRGVLLFQDDPASGSAWGMNYLTAIIYAVFGHNIFAAQSFCAVIGAATSPMMYFCAKKIFNNLNVAKLSAISIAVFPSFIIWSGQLLKDGLIIFLLVTIMTMVMQLQEKLNYRALAVLVFSLAGILSLRFYIFYIVLVAVVGSFLIGSSSSNRSLFRNAVVMILLAFALIYFGIGRNVSTEYEVFGNLQRVQSSRSDLARAADSGFGTETDVSTPEGALSAMPVGFAYLMFAPFPWQASNLRQAITIPEVLVWWAMIPFLIMGLVYAVKYRLRNAFPVLIFSLLLTLAYSVFQGNVGTAYRQRTQIQVFLFIFIGVGWTVYKERKENERILRLAAQKRVDNQFAGGGRLSQNV